ncbi:helix-turn-helix protein [Promicromonospora sp. AC04]|uniref:helix-turn-helix transcriptional regulator n=1 Tax=Promicromonospora sp. AC04 TaxID=2135723 RepID=UPI000D3A6FCC|nr:helix-turn-helix transcriptional regulator [Promicromonospora sp. AC04]PUB29801.1 helix-turn-helix protein [Promicromonospora sp. AC04]
MSGSTELGGALRAWRDRTTPASVGLPAGGVRRAAGLRREELSLLANLSVDYIIRLEQGRATAPSAQVLSALARALRLSDAEREHLYVLAGQSLPGPGQISQVIPAGVRRLIDQLDGAPLSVNDAAWNMILWNPLWAALLGDPTEVSERERNPVWRHFVGPRYAVRQTPDHGARFEAAMVADLRAARARYPADAGLLSLVSDLRDASAEFARQWDAGVVGDHVSNHKTVLHPVVGAMVLDCDVLTVPGSDLRIVVYTAVAGSADADRLKLLGTIGTQVLTEPRSSR